MISKENQSLYRSDLFRHLDGIVTIPTAYSLLTKGILKGFIENADAFLSIAQLSTDFNANEGYLNVALRVLSSQGWLTQKVDNKKDEVHYKITDRGLIASKYFHLYASSVELLKISANFHPRKFEVEPFLKLEKVYHSYMNAVEQKKELSGLEAEIFDQIAKHIEGIILGPTIVHLGMSGMFHKYFMEASFKPEEFHQDAESFERLLNILVHFDLFSKQEDVYQFTEKGLFFARRASAYGVTVSYIPTLRRLDQLLFGDISTFRNDGDGAETHVDRAMNVWGSGGAHTNYFKVIDKIIIDLFNKPIEDQPKGILDMGCGNGAFLKHLYFLVEQHTLRGKMLDEYPLILVGVDYNEEALKITKANLIQSEIWAKVVWGDIGRPDLLASDLQQNYNVELGELLNVRTFLDHNRIWNAPTNNTNEISKSTGAYSFKGERLNNNDVEQSLVEHFKKWQPYFKKFGLIAIELHTIQPELMAENIGKSAATAYDATHGYSDQFIVETDVFENAINKAGLTIEPSFSAKFPNNDLATVTVNLLR